MGVVANVKSFFSSFKVIVPAIIQLILNKVDLPVNFASIIPQSPSDVLLSLNTSISSPLPATIGATTLYLYNKDTEPFTPYLPIPLATVKVNGKTDISITNKTVSILDTGELVKWFREYLVSEQKDLYARANSSDVYLGKLHYTPKLDKVIPIPGLRNLEGVGMEDLKIELKPVDGKNLWAKAVLPNWGPITLGLGNLTLDVLSGDLVVGKVDVYDVLLKPGNNTIACDGFFNLTAVAGNLGNILQTQSGPLGGGKVELGLRAGEATLHGERLTFVEEILKDKVFKVNVSIFNLATSLLDGVLGAASPSLGGGGGGGGSDDDGKSTSSVLDAIGSAFSNKTLMDDIKGYLDL